METLETDAKIFRSGYTSVLKIGFHGEIFKQDLIEALKVFHQCMPQVKVELVQLSELKMLEDLHEGLLDIICIPHLDAFTTEKWLEVQKLCEIAPILVVSKNHPIASKDSVTMEEISQLELIRFVDGDQMNWDNDLEAFEEKPRIYDTVSDHTSCEILLSSGYGVGMWSEKFSKKGHYPDLKFIKIEGFPCKYSCAIAWKKDKLTIAGEKFCELFKNQFNDSDIL